MIIWKTKKNMSEYLIRLRYNTVCIYLRTGPKCPLKLSAMIDFDYGIISYYLYYVKSAHI